MLEDHIKDMEEQRDQALDKARLAERNEERRGKEMTELAERLQHAKRREQKQADELQQMEEQYAERVRHLKDQN